MSLKKKLLDSLNGYKTYIVSAATVLYGVAGIIIGELEPNTALAFIAGGLGFSGLRHGLRKKY